MKKRKSSKGSYHLANWCWEPTGFEGAGRMELSFLQDLKASLIYTAHSRASVIERLNYPKTKEFAFPTLLKIKKRKVVAAVHLKPNLEIGVMETESATHFQGAYDRWIKQGASLETN